MGPDIFLKFLDSFVKNIKNVYVSTVFLRPVFICLAEYLYNTKLHKQSIQNVWISVTTNGRCAVIVQTSLSYKIFTYYMPSERLCFASTAFFAYNKNGNVNIKTRSVVLTFQCLDILGFCDYNFKT